MTLSLVAPPVGCAKVALADGLPLVEAGATEVWLVDIVEEVVL